MNAGAAANDTHCTFKRDLSQNDSELHLRSFGDSKHFCKHASATHLPANNK